MSLRTYYDPLHHAITIDSSKPEEAMIMELIDSSPFQRLRRIRQLGPAFLTFHGAESSRFTHSIGVFHIARRAFENLLLIQPELENFRGLLYGAANRDPERFKDAKSRKRHSEDLVAEFDRGFKTQPREYWAKRFDAEDVWWAPAQSLAEVVEDEQLHAAGGFIEIPAGEVEEKMTAVASPVTFRGDPLTHTGPIPALGEHTAEVLSEVGMSQEEIEKVALEGN